ncbi:hypothetical protein Q0812_12425 [Brevundimonas sp. 2R-24]|uniref:Lipoprotein n=1 Tax=Peiella sedimenti TaxID=3061083 RepID=A0ABT8SNT3_9CAUL|nr:hypothetical protein [Caulobacteraceae bacterium XZ-24]
MRRAALVLMLSLGLGACAAARAPSLIQAAVLTELNDDIDLPPEDRRPQVTRVPPSMITRVNLDKDGVPDWRVDYGEAGLSVWCGTGGCLQKLYRGTEAGPVLVFENQVRELAVVDRAGERRLEIEVHGTHCGGAGVMECRFAFAWDPAADRWAERPSAQGTVLMEGGFPPMAETHPSELSGLVQSLASDCTEYTPRVEVFSVPDLDGDDARDWFVKPPYRCDSDSRVANVIVFLTRGGLHEAYRAQEDEVLAVDIATTPAALLRSRECDLGVCRFTPVSLGVR